MHASHAGNNAQLADRFSNALVAERARLVSLCTALTGSSLEAEDLAQEALLEAWRAREKLRDIEAFKPWLSAIARNVCLRYRRRRSRDHSHLVGYDPNIPGVSEQMAGDSPFTLA
jgi:RNA polymerase sigma factor (sigma-70 family)